MTRTESAMKCLPVTNYKEMSERMRPGEQNGECWNRSWGKEDGLQFRIPRRFDTANRDHDRAEYVV